jgi:hypothetical protein
MMLVGEGGGGGGGGGWWRRRRRMGGGGGRNRRMHAGWQKKCVKEGREGKQYRTYRKSVLKIVIFLLVGQCGGQESVMGDRSRAS